MIDKMYPEGVINLCSAMIHRFKKDIKYNLCLKEKYSKEKLDKLSRECDAGVMGMILDLAGTDFDGLVRTCREELK